MSTSTQWQLARDAAERYERILVPAILGPAAVALVEYAGPRPGQAVLDVGCGTGAAARGAAERVGRSGRVVGVDVNAGMIDVAQSLPPVDGAEVAWSVQSACALAFPDGAFDVVLCAQTLQFVEDRQRALAEMHRVLVPGGELAVSLWCNLGASPYFDALVRSVTRHIGADTAAGLRAACGLSDPRAIRALIEGAGFRRFEAVVEELDLPLPELAGFVPRHVGATPMAAGYRSATEAQQRAVVRDVVDELARFRVQGEWRLPFRTHLAKAIKAGR